MCVRVRMCVCVGRGGGGGVVLICIECLRLGVEQYAETGAKYSKD